MYSRSLFIEWDPTWNVDERPRVHDEKRGERNRSGGTEGASE